MGSAKQKNYLTMKTFTLFLCLSFTLTLSAQKSGIVFNEDFESDSKEKMMQNWDDSDNLKGMSFSSDVPSGSKGRQSLMMSYSPGTDTGGFLYKMFPEGF